MRRVENVLSLINTLSIVELRRVQEVIKVRLSHGLPVVAEQSSGALLTLTILSVIVDECRGKGLDQLASPGRLTQSAGFKSFRHKVEEEGVGEYLRMNSKKSKVRMQALARMAIELLIEDLQRMGIAVSARTVMNQIHRIPAVLDRAFPGYAAGGLLYLAVRED